MISTFKTVPYLKSAFTPAETLLTFQTTHMCRRDLATNPGMEICRHRSKRHFAIDFLKDFKKGLQNITRISNNVQLNMSLMSALLNPI